MVSGLVISATVRDQADAYHAWPTKRFSQIASLWDAYIFNEFCLHQQLENFIGFE